MKRLLLAGVLVAGAMGVATPASAGPGGPCDGKVDVVCHEQPCVPGEVCHIDICLVWSGKCLV